MVATHADNTLKDSHRRTGLDGIQLSHPLKTIINTAIVIVAIKKLFNKIVMGCFFLFFIVRQAKLGISYR